MAAALAAYPIPSNDHPGGRHAARGLENPLMSGLPMDRADAARRTGACSEHRPRDFYGRGRAPVPTAALPGSPAKVAVLCARALAGESLFAAGDAPWDDAGRLGFLAAGGLLRLVDEVRERPPVPVCADCGREVALHRAGRCKRCCAKATRRRRHAA